MVQTDGREFRGDAGAEAGRRVHEAALVPRPTPTLDHAELRRLCLEAGADDVGFVEVDRSAIADEAPPARRLFASVRTYVVLVRTTNPDAVRSVSRAVANVAWKANHERLVDTAANVLSALGHQGVRGVSVPIGFPMDPEHEPGARPWELAVKPIAVEAGLGHMGVNRNVIHPKLGNFVLIDVVLIDAEVDRYDHPLDFNPCHGCNLCVAACPVGAVSRTEDFDFFACLTHNYREFLFGFEDWVHTVADAGSADEYRAKYDEGETRSMWQSLSFGANYKAAYCQAVCPAGDDIIGPYVADRAKWRRDVVLPLVHRVEPVYVRSGTDAERTVTRSRFKRARYLDYKPSLSTIGNLDIGLRHAFDRRRAGETSVSVSFTAGTESVVATIASGHLTTSRAEPDPVTCDARVELLVADYIGIIQGRPIAADGTPGYRLVGDPSALGALLACLDS
ncbi:hypothetical protein BH10ACT1_BH10ACT1_17620 [soil metagenome]